MIDVIVPKLSQHSVQSLLPPIDSLSMKLDLIETTDMEDKIATPWITERQDMTIQQTLKCMMTFMKPIEMD